ncbi:uncharacterized protein TrAtP1_003172 [Trichoderma atroviride]|uniref:uncharacterized protein n=1 Tax=Hypocrea atroviridis TaxID=63577 RepID=UPI0033343041|nr:hypothetical protein TrAtP1_003172 [Trichoderma atroviride]
MPEGESIVRFRVARAYYARLRHGALPVRWREHQGYATLHSVLAMPSRLPSRSATALELRHHAVCTSHVRIGSIACILAFGGISLVVCLDYHGWQGNSFPVF